MGMVDGSVARERFSTSVVMEVGGDEARKSPRSVPESRELEMMEEANGKDSSDMPKGSDYTFVQVFSGALYMVVSIMITFANKTVLTYYKMESFIFLSLSQAVVSVILLPGICRFKGLSLPSSPWAAVKKLSPLPLIAVINATFSLGSTERLSIPMMTVLRRFTILFTMMLELWILRVNASPRVMLTVAMMIGGAIIAAADDLVFSLSGYIFVFISDLFTALNGVFNKKKLDECKEVGMHGMLFINSLVSIPIMFAACVATGDLKKVMGQEHWGDPFFIFWFVMASVLGLALNFSMLYCTNHNSALTTSVLGCLKNIVVTYCGMVFAPGYVYTLWNFAGINVSVFGSVVYSYVRHIERNR